MLNGGRAGSLAKFRLNFLSFLLLLVQKNHRNIAVKSSLRPDYWSSLEEVGKYFELGALDIIRDLVFRFSDWKAWSPVRRCYEVTKHVTLGCTRPNATDRYFLQLYKHQFV